MEQQPPAKRQRRDTSLVIYCHDDCARHITTSDGDAEHQESPARLAAIAAAAQNYATRRDLRPRAAKLITRSFGALPRRRRAHRRARPPVADVLRTRVLGESGVDGTAGATPVGPGTWTAATRAAGAALAAVRDATPARAPLCSCGRRAPRDARGLRRRRGRLRVLRAGQRCGRRGGGFNAEETRVAIVDFRRSSWQWHRRST